MGFIYNWLTSYPFKFTSMTHFFDDWFFYFPSTDLGSLNVQRGRDIGIPSYNRWRTFCSLSSASSFEALSSDITDSGVRQLLASLYRTPGNFFIVSNFLFTFIWFLFYFKILLINKWLASLTHTVNLLSYNRPYKAGESWTSQITHNSSASPFKFDKCPKS